VQGILASRIDRLAPQEKALLQQLAVIGREFPLSLVRHVIAQPEDELYRLLSSLQRKEFLYEQPAFPEVEYIFKHALTQEVAYGTVLQEQRKLLHERTGHALEALYAATLPEHYDDLAHHYGRSNNIAKAIEYLHLAGQQAVQRSANPEAISHLTAALDLLLTCPETPERATQELQLRLTLGPTVMIAQGWTLPEVEQHYVRARELCAQLGDSPRRFPVLWGLWMFYMVRGDMRTVQVLAEECLQLAEQTNEAGLLLEAHFAIGGTFFTRGEFVRARTALEQSVALYQPQHHALALLYGGYNPQVVSLAFTAWTLWVLGFPEQALMRMHEMLHLARELGHPLSLVIALCWVSWLHGERGEGRVAQEHADAGLALSSEHGFPFYVAWGTVQRGIALVAQGQWAEGGVQVRQGLNAQEGEVMKTVSLAWLATGYGGVGQAEEGLAAVAEALAKVEKNDERWYEAELYRIKGLLLTQEIKSQNSKGKSQNSEIPNTQYSSTQAEAEAEACFLKAIDIARQQHAKSLELRATVSLARLWQQQGQRTEAHQRLSEIYNWFTEGFDTKDLQEAKALLEELS
jgi:predicted ATPase